MGNRSKSISIRGDLASLLLRDPASLLQAQDMELGRGGREVGGGAGLTHPEAPRCSVNVFSLLPPTHGV